MTAKANVPRHPFLDATEAETTADLGALRVTLAEAARDAEKLGLAEVKEQIDGALAGITEHSDDGSKA